MTKDNIKDQTDAERVPNDETKKAIEEARQGIDVQPMGDIDEFFEQFEDDEINSI